MWFILTASLFSIDLWIDAHIFMGVKTERFDPPSVTQMEPASFDARFCEGLSKCYLMAIYDVVDNRVYIKPKPDTMSSTYYRSFIFHELIHSIQHQVLNQDLYDCDSWRYLEYQAYVLQNEWLRKNKVAGRLKISVPDC